MRQLLTVLFTFLFLTSTFSQRKTRADRFFENGDYLNAITAYKKEQKNTSHTKKNTQNLAISYFNTFQFKEAYRYLSYVVKGRFVDKDKSYKNHFNFKLYHVLSALGEYDKAIPYLEKYHKNLQIAPAKRVEAINTIEEFKLKDDTFTISTSKLNTERAEFGAVRRDSTLYFTSDRSPHHLLDKNYKWTHRPFLDLYKTTLDSLNKPKNDPISISEKINGRLHEGNFCFSNDGKTLYLSRSNYDHGKKKFDTIRNNPIHLYKSVKNDSLHTWSKPEKLPFNDVNYNAEHPALSPNGKRLYFSSNKPGGYGEFDIYYVTVESDSTYSAPVNLGPKINTVNREQFPFINNNGDLFFASNGHFGLGMLDIFAAKNNHGQFDTPINLGAPINSSFDDFSLTYYDKNKGFFASNRYKSGDDIYEFTQIETIFPKPLEAIFEVKDFLTQKKIPKATLTLINYNKEVLFNQKLADTLGYKTTVIPGKYNFAAKAPNYITNNKPVLINKKENKVYTIYLKQVAPPVVAIEAPKKPLTLKEKLIKDPIGPPVTEKNGKLYFELPPIYFDFDKWNIRKDSKKVLDELALKLEKYRTVYVKISAHTDSRGTASYNQILSERRAESTRNYLALVGYVNARRLSFEGFGESQPLISCEAKKCTEEEHQTNRRSEFEIVKF